LILLTCPGMMIMCGWDKIDSLLLSHTWSSVC